MSGSNDNMGLRLGVLGSEKPIFRVVETQRGSDGRLSQIGQIWHSNLDEVRKFGRAVAANTTSKQVLIADAAGNVLEAIAATPAYASGWDDWRNIPLPPLPPMVSRKKPKLAIRPQPAPAATANPFAPVTPPVDLPVVHTTVDAHAPPAESSAADPDSPADATPASTEDAGTDVAVVLP